MKYRVKFSKGEEMKFIGHLDVMRLFQRAIKRADLPIAYSKGFNPHQLLAFANPLSLGMTSGGEYGDFEMEKEVEPKEIAEKLQRQMPEGICILDVVLLPKKTPKAMASVEAAGYRAILDRRVTPEMGERFLSSFLDQKEILMMKKTKHHLKETDIRPDILEMKQEIRENQVEIHMILSAGSNRSVKAELVLQSFYEWMGLDFDRFQISFERSDLFRIRNEGQKRIPLNQELEEFEEEKDEKRNEVV